MKTLVSLLLIVCNSATAQTAPAFNAVNDAQAIVISYPQDGLLQRAVNAGQYCDKVLKLWPAPEYSQGIQTLGQLWSASPEAANYVLRICQTKWMNTYLKPALLPVSEQAEDHARFAYLLASFDSIDLPKYLRQEIHLFNSIIHPVSGKIPQSPFQILNGMASSDQDLDEAIHYELNQSLAQLAAATTALGTAFLGGMEVTKDVASVTKRVSLTAGRAAKQALLITIVSFAVEYGTNQAMLLARQSEIWDKVNADVQAIMKSDAPNDLLIQDFEHSVKTLGYAMNYALYSKDSNIPGTNSSITPSANSSCRSQIASFFSAANPPAYIRPLMDKSICSDSALVWAAASQFLTWRWPNDAFAHETAERLMSRAKRAYISYKETDRFERQHYCGALLPFGGPMARMTCRWHADAGDFDRE